MKPSLLLSALLLTASPFAFSETVKDREGAVRGDKARMESYSLWIYNDIDAGFAQAKQTGKPLLVVMRCVPCLACGGIDASVLEEKELEPLLGKFVCVRVINANAIDLTKFQFDYDLSFSALLFNGDGTLYGRYGSWQHQKDPLDKTTAGFRKALEAGLAIHQGYPANKAALAGKQGGPTPYKTPVEFPTLAARYQSKLDWDGKVVQSCVHCHMVGDAIRASFRTDKKAVPLAWIFPQPALETLGATLAPDEIAKVSAVTPNTPAAKAGLRVGDQLTSLGGQPLISIADVRWALHRAPDAGTLPATVQRDGRPMPITLTLPSEWRFRSDISGRVGTWPMRAMAFGGMKVEDIDDAGRTSLGLKKDQLALRILFVGQYGPHAAAKDAGFKKDDVLVQVANLTQRMDEGALIGHLLQDHRPGEKLPSTVLRGKEQVKLQLPQQ